MKIMSKVKIIKKNSVKNINNEKKFLSMLHHPFLVNMICSFQDNDNLYLVMELLLGGDMRYHINKKIVYNKKKDENQLKFIAGCVLIGLNYIHENKIIHKDIKPENLVYDTKGYIHITDFGISKIYHPENGKENSGTPGYMAPEVLFSKDHDYSVDFFSLGVCLYELLMGKRPYRGHNKKELRKDIVTRQARINEESVPDGFIRSNNFFDCINFINGLIERKKEKRLGYNGFKEIKEHSWLIDFNWDDLLNKKIQPSFIPPLSDSNYDKKYCNEIEKIGDTTQREYNTIKNKIEYYKYFENYTFNNEIFTEKIEKKDKKGEFDNKNDAIISEKKDKDKDKKNIFNIKKNINNIFKDKKIVKTFFKNNNNQLLINHNGNTSNNIILSNNKKNFADRNQMNGTIKKNRNYFNDTALYSKMNSNFSTGNIFSDKHPLYDRSIDKYKSHNKRINKEDSSSNYNNYNYSLYMNIYYSNNKNYFSFYKKNQQNKKLPSIYKNIKKSVSVENIFDDKRYGKILGYNKKSDRMYNPSTLYGKYLPYKIKEISENQPYSYYNKK